MAQFSSSSLRIDPYPLSGSASAAAASAAPVAVVPTGAPKVYVTAPASVGILAGTAVNTTVHRKAAQVAQPVPVCITAAGLGSTKRHF